MASTGDFRTSLEYYPSCDYAASAKWVESDVSRRLWREFCTDSSGIGDVFQVQGSKNEGALHASCDFRNLRRNRTGYLWNHLTEEEAIYLLDDWWCHFRNLFDGIWNNQLHNGRIRDFWGGKLHHGNRRQWYVSSVYRHCYCFGNRVFADFFFWKDEAGETDAIQKKSGKEIVKTPIQGQIAPLNAAKDAAFAQGTLGRGILIYPEKGEVRAPFDGTVMTLFPTKHAIGMVSETGLELLIHVGLDTVQLEGKYFESLVQQGERVKQGDLLLRFDKKKIEKEGYSLETPVIVTNYTDYLDILENQGETVGPDDALITALT